MKYLQDDGYGIFIGGRAYEIFTGGRAYEIFIGVEAYEIFIGVEAYVGKVRFHASPDSEIMENRIEKSVYEKTRVLHPAFYI